MPSQAIIRKLLIIRALRISLCVILIAICYDF